MLKTIRWRLLLACLLCVSFITSAAHAQSDSEWAALKGQVQERASQLETIIEQANSKGLSTAYASVSRHVISTYLLAAQHDKDHVEEVRKIFHQRWWSKKTDPKEADNLPWNELNACVEVADHAIAELQQQIDGKITLADPPDFHKGKMTLGTGTYQLNGKPVFPYSLVWLPETEQYTQAMGNIGGVYYQLSNMKDEKSVAPFLLKGSIEETKSQVQLNSAPLVHLLGHAPAQWMTKEHPEIAKGARNFTKYDIDSPKVRAWIEQLCKIVLPKLTAAGSDQPQLHLLANEPHFATKKGGWKASNGVSELTMQKYRDWIAAHYKTVEAVNESQGSSFASLDDVTVDMPIDSKLRGSAVWYDWCRFNMDRVNDWFAFLKKTTQAADPSHSPVTIKTLGHTLGSDERDGGMDIEYLTKLQDVPGSDLRVVPQGATHYGKNEDGRDTETGWASRYAYLWVDQSMMLDFSRSLCPDRPFYDSEWHGFGSVGWRHHHMERSYVRSALWLAFSHGMGMIKPWLWGRELDGSLNPKADHIGELATQPTAVDAYCRVMKELNAHAEQVSAALPRQRQAVIFYCEESAIQSDEYMPHLTDVYESLKLLNLNVGFVTPSDIKKLDSSSQTLVITPTPYISDESLASISDFQKSNGRIVLVDGDKNFQFTERGARRQNTAKVTGYKNLPLQHVLPMADDLEKIFATLRPTMPLTIEVMDEGGTKAYGVIATQSVDPQSGIISVILNNVSKDVRIVNLRPSKERSGTLGDSITRQPVKGTLRLEPCDVRALKAALR